jgi:hypothetical protein
MYYKVIDENAFGGKCKFSQNQTIGDFDLVTLINDMKSHRYEILDGQKFKTYRFYDFQLFHKRKDVYSLSLLKL